MLIAKINPAAQAVNQNSPFNVQSVDCDMMTAIARPYHLGATEVNFEVIYGTATITGPTASDFKNQIRTNVTLTSAELTGWGTDDTFILGKIATKVGTTIVETYVGEGK